MNGDYCHRYAKVAWKYDAEKQRVVMFRLRCWQWSCPYCARMNATAWRLTLINQLPKLSNSWWLMTLTARSDTRGRIESYKQLSRGIDILMHRFKRAFGKVTYVRIFEKHPLSDALHAHFIISGLSDYIKISRSGNGRDKYTPTNFRAGKRGYWALRTFVKKTSQGSRMGYIADCKSLEGTHRAIGYVTKYMTKSAQDFDIRSLRHVATTRDIKSPRGRGKNTRAINVGHFIPRSRIPQGYALIDRDTGEAVDVTYWQENAFYPPHNDKDNGKENDNE